MPSVINDYLNYLYICVLIIKELASLIADDLCAPYYLDSTDCKLMVCFLSTCFKYAVFVNCHLITEILITNIKWGRRILLVTMWNVPYIADHSRW